MGGVPKVPVTSVPMSCVYGKMNILAQSKTLSGRHTVVRLQNRCGSPIPMRRAGWLAGARGGGARGISAGPAGLGAAIGSTAATWFSTASPRIFVSNLSDIQSQGFKATQIVDRHRSMLRSHQLDMKPIDLHAVIDESQVLVDHELAVRQIDANIDLSSNPCVISGDPVLLQQVLVNLVINAMDAMAGTPRARRHVTIRTEVRAGDVELSVSDTGTGLPAQIDGNLFTPFVTTKAHGLGIGLTIVRTIVEAHGGTIAARNNLDGGATFIVTLPRSEASNIQ